MVDQIQNAAAVNPLLRAQAAGITALKSNNQATQALITQLQKTASVPVVNNAVTQPAQLASSYRNLPRGSIVDKLA